MTTSEIKRLVSRGATKAGSQNKFARAIGVGPALVSRWLHPETPQRPRPESCQKIADYLGIDVTTVMRAAGYPSSDATRGTDSDMAMALREVEDILTEFPPAERLPVVSLWREVARLVGSRDDSRVGIGGRSGIVGTEGSHSLV